eukprot:312321-Rhodomonas_salina.1
MNSQWGEPGVFVGLGTAENKKAWLVYAPRLNKIFASHDIQFDETFFPLWAEDQRVYCTFDYNVVKEMRASNQVVTLDQQAPSLVNSDIWDPALAQQALEQNYSPQLNVDGDVTDPGATDGGSVPDDSDHGDDASPPTTQRAMDETSFA